MSSAPPHPLTHIPHQCTQVRELNECADQLSKLARLRAATETAAQALPAVQQALQELNYRHDSLQRLEDMGEEAAASRFGERALLNAQSKYYEAERVLQQLLAPHAAPGGALHSLAAELEAQLQQQLAAAQQQLADARQQRAEQEGTVWWSALESFGQPSLSSAQSTAYASAGSRSRG